MILRKDILLMDLVQSYPKAIEVLNKYNMNCSRCLGLPLETLEDAAKAHGINVDELIDELMKNLK